MASLGGTYDASQGEQMSDRSALPPGEYLAAIAKSDVADTKRGDGGRKLDLEFEVLDGPHKGRRFWTTLNLWNRNPQAVEIAQRELNSICHAVGKLRVERLVAEHDAPLRIAENAERPPCRFCRHKGLCFEAAMPRRNCRTCLHFAFGRDAAGHCMRFDEPRSPQRQHEGADCPAHLFLPALVPGEQIDADPEAETVTYRLRDGTIWKDGGSEEAV